MTETVKATELSPEQEAIIADIIQNLGIKRDVIEVMPLPLPDWPTEITIFFAYRKDRFGRIYYQYACFDGELYSPFAPDGGERLLKRVLDSRRFELSSVQMVNLLLIYHRPEPLMTLLSDINQDLSPSSREALAIYYGIKDISPQMTLLDEDRKLVFWTINIRRETIKRWVAYIANTGRVRISEDVKIELKNAREGYE